jgi:hypothetical protein
MHYTEIMYYYLYTVFTVRSIITYIHTQLAEEAAQLEAKKVTTNTATAITTTPTT